MTQWTPQIEKLIREVGEKIDKQMKNFVNPKKGNVSTFLRCIFNGKSVQAALAKASKEAGLEYKGWSQAQQNLIELAAQNNSDAADKIKKWAAVSDDIAAQFKDSPSTFINQIKYAKKTYGQNV